MTKLFVVATPIGNLEDLTLRALSTLKEVDFVAAEDTRQSKKLFDKYEIETRLVSFHAQSSETKTQELINRIKEGESAALISDAGTPCISDPGFRLVKLAAQNNITVIPIPGPSALTALISVSGFPTDKFMFHGFLPHKKGRQTLMSSFKESATSHIFYESVHRFHKCLDELENHLGSNHKICVGRELTKMHEEVFRGSVMEAKSHFKKENTRGEFVIIVAPENFN